MTTVYKDMVPLLMATVLLSCIISGCSSKKQEEESKQKKEESIPSEDTRGVLEKEPADQNVSEINARYRFVSLEKERTSVRFEGVGQKEDGTYVFQIGWGDTVYTVDDSCSIHGFTVTNFEEKTYTRRLSPDQKITTVEKKVELVGKKKNLILRMGKKRNIKELCAKLEDLREGKTFKVHVDSNVNDDYQVKEISAEAVVLVDKEGNESRLRPSPDNNVHE